MARMYTHAHLQRITVIALSHEVDSHAPHVVYVTVHGFSMQNLTYLGAIYAEIKTIADFFHFFRKKHAITSAGCTVT